MKDEIKNSNDKYAWCNQKNTVFCINIIKWLKTLQQFNWAIVIIRIYIDYGNLVIITSPKTSLNLPFKNQQSLILDL